MKKTTKNILYGTGAIALLLVGWTYFRSAKKLISLSPEVVGFKIHKVDWTRLVLRFDVQVQNPSSSDITISDLNGSISNGGTAIGSFSNSSSYVCPGNNKLTTIKNIEVSASVTKIITLVTNLIAGKEASFTIDGYIVADGNTFPFSTTQKLSV